MKQQVIRREDYQPYPFVLSEAKLDFVISDSGTTVRSKLTFARKPGTTGSLVLDGEDLELRRVAVDGVELKSNEYAVDDASLTIFDVPDAFEVEIEVGIRPDKNEALAGLYTSGQMYCTQCEPSGMRRITYFPDRPDVLSVFTTTVTADAERYPILLSNGDRVGVSGPDAAGRHSATWLDRSPKPSYLFALVAGDLAVLEDEFVTCSGRTVVLRIYSEPHNIGQCGYPMGALKRAMRWDEGSFGREYELDTYTIVAVEDFSFGAMENKALNIFNTSMLLADKDTATDGRARRVEGVVAHEYFHNASGNRVTVRLWHDLALKEGFTVLRDQLFSESMGSAALKRIEDADFLRSVQFVEDAGPLAHSVRPDSYMAVSNLYTRTVYEKGAEVARMIRTLVGPERFRAGCDLYFERHDGDAVTIEDFVRAIEDGSGVDLAQFRRWYGQAGTPTLTVDERRDGDSIELHIAQSCAPTPGQPRKESFPIPLAFGLVSEGHDALGATGAESGFAVVCDASTRVENPAGDGTLVAAIEEEETKITLRGIPADAEVSMLRGFSAPVKVDWRRSPATLRRLATSDPELVARWDAAQDLLAATILATTSGRAGDGWDDALGMVADLAAQALEAADDGEAKAHIALALTLPSADWLLENSHGADILAIARARDALADRLSGAAGWLELVNANATNEPYRAEPVQMARRHLKHVALHYAIRRLGREAPDRAHRMLTDMLAEADNLTDRVAALRELVALASLDAVAKATVVEEFYQRWAHEALVVDTWFTIQAQNPLPGGLARVQGLMNHPAFTMRNPNKVRALVGAFGDGNPANFHDGNAAYLWLVDVIAELDAINPQVAARQTRTLISWRRHSAARAAAMRAALERLGEQGLSKDTSEIVVKSLADY